VKIELFLRHVRILDHQAVLIRGFQTFGFSIFMYFFKRASDNSRSRLCFLVPSTTADRKAFEASPVWRLPFASVS